MSVGESRRLRRYLIESLKWLLAVGLIWALVRSGRLSFENVKDFLARPGIFALCFAVSYTMLLSGFLRWKFLVSALGVRVSVPDAIRLGMVGQFFSAVIPGTISGDLVKAVFVARKYPENRMATVSTVLLDRILGLSALIWVGAVSFLVGLPKLLALTHPMAPLLRSLGWGLVTLTTLIVLGLSFLGEVQKLLMRYQPARMQHWKLVRTAHALLDGYVSNRGVLWRMIFFSILFHISSIFVFYQIARASFGPGPWGGVDLPIFAMVTVMGLCAMSLPIAPLGLGVGQLAFATMFSIAGASSPDFGASIITSFQILNLIINLSGGLFYLTYRHQVVREAPDAAS